MTDYYLSPSGKVHVRREVWYPGTKDERAADPDMPIMLCGQRNVGEKVVLEQLNTVPDEITCGTCRSAYKPEKSDG